MENLIMLLSGILQRASRTINVTNILILFVVDVVVVIAVDFLYFYL